MIEFYSTTFYFNTVFLFRELLLLHSYNIFINSHLKVHLELISPVFIVWKKLYKIKKRMWGKENKFHKPLIYIQYIHLFGCLLGLSQTIKRYYEFKIDNFEIRIHYLSFNVFPQEPLTTPMIAFVSLLLLSTHTFRSMWPLLQICVSYLDIS